MARKPTAKPPLKPKKAPRKRVSQDELMTTVAIQEMALKGFQLRIATLKKDQEQTALERDVAVEGAVMQHAEMIRQDLLVEAVLAEVDGLLDRITAVLNRLATDDAPTEPAKPEG